MLVVCIDLLFVLEVLEDLPAQILVLQPVPFNPELLYEVSVVSVLRRQRQRIDVLVALHLDVVHPHFRNDPHVQHAIHLQKVGIEVHVRSVRAQIEQQILLLLLKQLGIAHPIQFYLDFRFHARTFQIH